MRELQNILSTFIAFMNRIILAQRHLKSSIELRECVLTELRTVNNKNYKVELYTISILMKVWKIKKAFDLHFKELNLLPLYKRADNCKDIFFHSYTGIAIYFVIY